MDGNLILKIFGLFMLGCMCLGLGEFTCELLNLWGLIPSTLVLIGFNYIIYRAIVDEDLIRTLTITTIPMILTYAVGVPMGLAAYKENKETMSKLRDPYSSPEERSEAARKLGYEQIYNADGYIQYVKKVSDKSYYERREEEYKKYKDIKDRIDNRTYLHDITAMDKLYGAYNVLIYDYLWTMSRLDFDLFDGYEEKLGIDPRDKELAKEILSCDVKEIYNDMKSGKGYKSDYYMLINKLRSRIVE
uniref:hypothetical protein n=1 Tax=Anaerococcus mediterraneensis TaxID=1870984 RepID=UPI000931D0F4|nr:hypothetical protein [Anaerococcus mediterraneensis]